MVNRREALRDIGVALIAAVGLSRSAVAQAFRLGLAGGQGAAPATQPDGVANAAVDDRLRQDLARLAPRADSEEGVPVILACENLVVAKLAQKVSPVALTAFNATIVSEFRSNAAAWDRIQPNAPAGDVAKLIQILAYRDFAVLGMEQRL